MDQAWFLAINGLAAATPAIGAAADIIGKYAIALYPLLLLGLWIRPSSNAEQRRRVLLIALCAAIAALVVNALLNAVFPRPRPFLVLPAHVLGTRPHDPSFPSDHTAFTSAVAVTLWIGGDTIWGALGVFGALVIGTSRIAMGVHYPTDILGGVLVGGTCALIASKAETKLRPALDLALAFARRAHLA
jgi:undecaprenyl-diphosphatase